MPRRYLCHREGLRYGGPRHDGTGVIYFAYQEASVPATVGARLRTGGQIEGALLEISMPSVFKRCEAFYQDAAPEGLRGSVGQDHMGMVLLQHGQSADPNGQRIHR